MCREELAPNWLFMKVWEASHLFLRLVAPVKHLPKEISYYNTSIGNYSALQIIYSHEIFTLQKKLYSQTSPLVSKSFTGEI